MINVCLMPETEEKKTGARLSFRGKEICKKFFELCMDSVQFTRVFHHLNGVQITVEFNPYYSVQKCEVEIDRLYSLAKELMN